MNAIFRILSDHNVSDCGHSEHTDTILSLMALAGQWDETNDAARLVEISNEAKALATPHGLAVARDCLEKLDPTKWRCNDEELENYKAAAEEITNLLESEVPTPSELLEIFGVRSDEV